MRLREQQDIDDLRSSERSLECGGKSLRQLVEAELQRACIIHLRLREKAEGYGETLPQEIDVMQAEARGAIKAYSHSLLILTAPYQRGDTTARKRLVAEAMVRAKFIHERAKARVKEGRG